MGETASGALQATVHIEMPETLHQRRTSLRELDGEHADERRRRQMLHTMCAASAIVAAGGHAIRAAFGTAPSPLAWIAVAGIVSCLVGTMFLLRKGASFSRAATLAVGALVAGVPCLASQNGGMNAPIIALTPTIPIMAGLFLGYRKALWVGLILTLEVTLVAALGGMGILPYVAIPPLAKAAILVAFMSLNMVVVAVYEIERRAAESRLREVAAELYQSSIVDPLTLVFNRRHFADRLEEELAYARRHETRVGVLLIDADHFKRVNDTHGHDAGDHVLRTLANVLNDTLRAEDVLARYGGEEFVVLLRGVSSDELHIAGERMRNAVQSHRFELGRATLPMTISVGGASLRGSETDAEGLLSLADTRLYGAKHAGRNCVVTDGVFSMLQTSLAPMPLISKTPAPLAVTGHPSLGARRRLRRPERPGWLR